MSLYKKVHAETGVVHVYNDDKELKVKFQRGRRFIHFAGKQININQIPFKIQPIGDHVYNYIFEGLYKTYPCPAMEFWIYRHRFKNKITPKEYAIKFNVKKRSR